MDDQKLWAEMTTRDFEERDMSRVIAVLPVAAVEQHGPHLPVGTDAMIMEGYLKRVMARLPADVPVLFLPIQAIAASGEHQFFPGTLSLSPAAALQVWGEIIASVQRTGCRKLVLLNSHGGNVPIIDLLARDVRARHNMLAVTASWHRFGYPDGLYSPAERAHGIHGGDIETSLMLAFRPELVRMNEAENFIPASLAMEAEFTWLRANHPIGFGWMAQDLNPTGAMGDAIQANAAKGEASADYGATAFVELLQDIMAFDLARLEAGVLG